MDKFFFGSAISVVDSQGAITLPAAFVETLKRRLGDGGLFLGRHEEGHCLVVYDKGYFAQQQRHDETQPGALVGGTRTTHDNWVRTNFAFVDQIAVAEDGSIPISPIMRARGQIGTAVLLVGAGHRFEIWDLENVVARGPYDLSWLAQRHLQFQRMAGGGAPCQSTPLPVVLVPTAPRKRRAPALRLSHVQGTPPHQWSGELRYLCRCWDWRGRLIMTVRRCMRMR